MCPKFGKLDPTRDSRDEGRDNRSESRRALYTRGLEHTILQAVAKAGKDAARLTVEDLAPVDEFHVGGIQATKDLAAQMDLGPESCLLARLAGAF